MKTPLLLSFFSASLGAALEAQAVECAAADGLADRRRLVVQQIREALRRQEEGVEALQSPGPRPRHEAAQAPQQPRERARAPLARRRRRCHRPSFSCVHLT